MPKIEFRAWLPNAEPKMYYDIGVVRGKPYFTSTDFVYESSRTTTANGEQKTKYKFILMQYTNLKDKNGKKVFQGDILKSNALEIGIVEFSLEEARWVLKNTDDLQWSGSVECMTTWRVIGDIYSNPKLLTSK